MVRELLYSKDCLHKDISLRICKCLLCVSQQGPCVSVAVLNPPFEMGTWLPFGFPTGSVQRYPTPRLSATLTPVERILKRFGAQTFRCSLSVFSPSSLAFQTSHPPKRLLPFSAEGSFKGLGESAGAAVPARPRGCGAPTVKSTVSLSQEQRVGTVREGRKSP